MNELPNIVPLYVSHCQTCGASTSLPATTLAGIIRDRLLPTTGEPYIKLVCQQCTSVQDFDMRERKAVGVIPEFPRTEVPAYPIHFSLVFGCDDKDCDSLVELVAFRPHGTREEAMRAEVLRWNISGLRCENIHPLILPDSFRRP